MVYKKRFGLFFIIIFLILVSFTFVQAEERYSFENAEKMKPLIKWRDYGPDAFKEAEKENKPIFLLLTAPSWCYWCQVYESEDYLFNPRVLKLINEKFIPVYVDADKRQDLTRKYLEGGWPSTTIMAPNKKRIYGYSGPRPIGNMIVNLNNAVDYVKKNKVGYKISYDYEKSRVINLNEGFLKSVIDDYFSTVLRAYDSSYGGFGSGQKFPQGRTLDLALEMYEKTGDRKWLDLVKTTLENQYTKVEEVSWNYKLFDPIEGGFHRYGTTRSWTPPHYEKMLYDNARLLRVYFHLMQIENNNKIVKEVVEKTDGFIQREYYDSKNGGFYGNSDVHGEDSYYGKNPRPKVKPRVEKTKYTDWNSEAILTYLYLYEENKNENHKEMAIKGLDFFQKKMIDKNGAYHFYNVEKNEKAIQGNLFDNSYLMLAFIEGYWVLGDERYLDAAVSLADYSLDNLYDWNSGGFFERNSKDIDNYAPGENVDLGKPGEENGIMIYAMLRLYEKTDNIEYLNAGIKTLSVKMFNVGGLDNSYYYVKTSKFILDNNLLNKFSDNGEKISKIESDRLDGFWLNDLLRNPNKGISGFAVSDEGIDKLNGNFIILIFISLLAGLLSFVSPCTLPIMPAFVAYTMKSSGKNINGMTLSFFAGLSIIFVLLGVVSSFIGSFLKDYIGFFSQVTGFILIILGFSLIFGRGFSGFKIKQKRPASYFGSFLFGGIMGLSWTPCVGPILVAILLLASASGSAVVGGLLLFSYAIGLAVPLILVSSYLEKIDKKSRLWSFIRGKMVVFELSENKVFMVHSSSLIAGLLFIVLGLLIFSGQLFIFNKYFSDTIFQKWIFEIEEKLLNFVR